MQVLSIMSHNTVTSTAHTRTPSPTPYHPLIQQLPSSAGAPPPPAGEDMVDGGEVCQNKIA